MFALAMTLRERERETTWNTPNRFDNCCRPYNTIHSSYLPEAYNMPEGLSHSVDNSCKGFQFIQCHPKVHSNIKEYNIYWFFLSHMHWSLNKNKKVYLHQVVKAQWLAWWLATGEVPGSNPDKGDNLYPCEQSE